MSPTGSYPSRTAMDDKHSVSLSSEHDEEILFKGHYESMATDAERASQARWRRRSSTLTSICSLLTGLLTALAILLLVALLNRERQAVGHAIHPPSDPAHVTHPITTEEVHATWKGCGTSAMEARAKGCLYDVMLGGWIHADCYQSELMEKYLKAGNYTWYSDVSLTDLVSDAVVRRGEHAEIYTRLFYHYAHCAYLWEMQMKAYRERGAIDNVIFEEEHTEHCSGLLLHQQWENNVTTIYTGFDYCGKPWG